MQNVVFGLTTGSIYALIALGFSLVFKTSGILSFAHPQIMMVSGLLGYTLMNDLGLAYPVAALLCACAGAALSMLMNTAVLDPIRKRKGSENKLVVATIGVGLIMISLATLIWGPHALAYPQRYSGAPISIGGVTISPTGIGVLVTTVVVLAAFQLLVARTGIGIAMRACSADPQTASLIGIPVSRTIAVSFALSGALAGLAGVLLGLLYFASFDMGTSGLKSLCAAVIGGFGSLPGAVIGGLLLGLIEAFSSYFLPSQYNDTIVYGVLIGTLLLLPQGLLGLKQREL
jgi:branched-chain amino acid transport system permease protein